MPISNTDQLLYLIKSLSKSEKRSFTLYSNRNNIENPMFIKLFEVLDKKNHINDNLILEEMPELTKSKLSNMKRHLYSQILTSLRLTHINHNVAIEVRELFDYAEILYGKSLYLQSLKILQKAYQLAEKHELELSMLEIIEFQKIIESRHITRSGPIKNSALAKTASDLIKRIDVMISLSNLRLTLHSEYIRNGHIKDKNDYQRIKSFFKRNLPSFLAHNLNTYSKIYLYQSYVWYYFTLMDFEQCMKYSILWIEECKQNKIIIDRDSNLYMRGFHYLLTCAYNLGNRKVYLEYHTQMEQFRKNNYNQFNESQKMMSFLYVHSARLNKHFLFGSFHQGIADIPKTLKRIEKYRHQLDPHRLLVFYFKIAMMYFGNQQPDLAIDYLNRIINDKYGTLRKDIQGYSRILFLMCHYELDNVELLSYIYNTVSKFFVDFDQINSVQERMLHFFNTLITVPIFERQQAFLMLKEDLLELKKAKYEHRAFNYLNLMPWVESQIEKKTMAEIISEREFY